MKRYYISRLILVFLVKFFYSWASNIPSQLVQFFDLYDSFLFDIISILLWLVVICLGLITLNLAFTIIHMTEDISINELVNKIRDKGLLNSFKYFINNFLPLLVENYDVETKSEKHPTFFIAFVIIFLPFFKGNPIINNYYGIYKEYRIDDQGKYGERTDYIESGSFIFHKSEKRKIEKNINDLREEYDEYDYEPEFKVKKRGYIFIQAGLIDGYQPYYEEYSGFLSYVECLFYSALEKLIYSIMYFLIPFVTCILIYERY